MDFQYKSIGWIGLGLMGIPMVENLIKKTPESTLFHVYDVNETAVKEFIAKYPERSQLAQSSREVAEKSVCKRTRAALSLQWLELIGE
jgi:3-hydroxyisobutyrate dehydrogenase-like beta-hydroxyacid dehydrogenase